MAKENKKTSPVNIVGSKLILSLPEALEPVVWQMDIEQAQSSSFTIKEDKKAKSFNLVFKAQGNEAEDIAPFSDKQAAMDILMETSNALQRAKNVNPAPANNPTNNKGDKLGAFLAAALIIILILSWIILSSAPENLDDIGDGQTGYYDSSTGNPRESSGVAVSADDFLNNR